MREPKSAQYPLNGLADDLHGLDVSHCVPNANAEAMLQQPVVGHILALAQEGASCVWALLHPDDVDQAAPGCPQCLLADAARHQFTILDEHLRTPSP